METLSGPETIIFFATSTPNPLCPIIKIESFDIFSIVSKPNKTICREYICSSMLPVFSIINDYMNNKNNCLYFFKNS